MRSHPDEGLFGSLLIYASAVLGVLALVALPLWHASRPTVIPNVSAERVHEILAARRADGSFPVARLTEPNIFSPAAVAELNARSKQARLAQQTVAQVAQRADAGRPAPRIRKEHTRRTFADVRPVGANRPGPFRSMYNGAIY